jgi:N12 class adenine-specific DNA methylase
MFTYVLLITAISFTLVSTIAEIIIRRKIKREIKQWAAEFVRTHPNAAITQRDAEMLLTLLIFKKQRGNKRKN